MNPRHILRPAPARALVIAALLAGAGCRADGTQVGSACINGICPQTAQQGTTCTLSASLMEVRDLEGFVCLDSALIDEADDRVACQLFWYDSGAAGPLAVCDDHAFLESGAGTGSDCRVRQLTAGDASPSAGDGWFAEREPDSTRCSAGQTSVGFRLPFVEGELPSSVVVVAECTHALTRAQDGDIELVDSSECAAPGAEAQGVGAACLPAAMPEFGFDDRSVYVETGSQDCETGTCVVYRLAGDPRKGCVPRPANEMTGDPGTMCPESDKVEASVYCSCRCDAPPGSGSPECDCPDGFSCVDAVTAPEFASGGYCIRNGTFPQ